MLQELNWHSCIYTLKLFGVQIWICVDWPFTVRVFHRIRNSNRFTKQISNMSSLPVSDKLMVQLELLRPICHRWNRPGGCKQGRHCKFRHDSDASPDSRTRAASDLPYCARRVDSEGKVYIVAMPPIEEAMNLYWEFLRSHFFYNCNNILDFQFPILIYIYIYIYIYI